MPTDPKDACSICGHHHKSRTKPAWSSQRCPHPWDTPFEHRPKNLLLELHRLIPLEPHPGS